MESIRYKNVSDLQALRRQQLQRLRRAAQAELTPRQRRILLGVYLEGKSQAQLAQEDGVNRSTVCRTLRRAEDRLRRCLQY